MSAAASSQRRPADLAGFAAACRGIELLTDAATLARKSRDHYWFSPILREELEGRVADVVALPRSREDLHQLVRAAVAHGVPITPRGAGTGTFGQGVPLAGGVVVDFAHLNRLLWQRGSTCRAEAGIVLGELDRRTRAHGWELRIHPSTREIATLGGFIAGGHAGIGCVNYGIVRDPGNLLAVQILTAEAEPRVIEMRGDDVETVHHAYGVNGLITEVELPLAPAYAWQDVLIGCRSLRDAAALGAALAGASGLLKKVVSVVDGELARHFTPLKALMQGEETVLIAMVAEESMEALRSLVASHGAAVRFAGTQGSGPGGQPFFEYTWGHTTLHVLKAEPAVTNLACVFDADDLLPGIERLHAEIGHEAPLHLEFIRFGGRLNAQAVPLVHYLDREQIASLTRRIEACGARGANLHTYFLQNGGMKRIDEAQLAFKRASDPHGLLNPGKVQGLADAAVGVRGAGVDLEASGWAY